MVWDWLRKRIKQQRVNSLNYLIELEELKKEELKEKIKVSSKSQEQLEKSQVQEKNFVKKIYASKDVALITTETDIEIKKIKVTDDSKIKFGKKEIVINPTRKAHTLIIPLYQIIPTRLGRWFSPRKQILRAYTFQREGEITHNPHDDKLDKEDKARLELVLKIQGTATKADIVRKIMAGMKEKIGFWDYFRDVLYILVIIFLILANNVLPHLKG